MQSASCYDASLIWVMKLTGINLSNLGQRQPHLIAIEHRLRLLQRVAFEVDRFQFPLVLQLLLNLVKVT